MEVNHIQNMNWNELHQHFINEERLIEDTLRIYSGSILLQIDKEQYLKLKNGYYRFFYNHYFAKNKNPNFNTNRNNLKNCIVIMKYHMNDIFLLKFEKDLKLYIFGENFPNITLIKFKPTNNFNDYINLLLDITKDVEYNTNPLEKEYCNNKYKALIEKIKNNSEFTTTNNTYQDKLTINTTIPYTENIIKKQYNICHQKINITSYNDEDNNIDDENNNEINDKNIINYKQINGINQQINIISYNYTITEYVYSICLSNEDNEICIEFFHTQYVYVKIKKIEYFFYNHNNNAIINLKFMRPSLITDTILYSIFQNASYKEFILKIDSIPNTKQIHDKTCCYDNFSNNNIDYCLYRNYNQTMCILIELQYLKKKTIDIDSSISCISLFEEQIQLENSYNLECRITILEEIFYVNNLNNILLDTPTILNIQNALIKKDKNKILEILKYKKNIISKIFNQFINNIIYINKNPQINYNIPSNTSIKNPNNNQHNTTTNINNNNNNNTNNTKNTTTNNTHFNNNNNTKNTTTTTTNNTHFNNNNNTKNTTTTTNNNTHFNNTNTEVKHIQQKPPIPNQNKIIIYILLIIIIYLILNIIMYES